MLSQQLFYMLVVFVALQRLAELWWSRRNEQALIAQGGVRCAQEHFKWMKLIHASWLLAIILEVWFFNRSFDQLLGSISLFLFMVGQILRITAITTLGPRWTAAIVVLPGKRLISKGIYRFIKHPNYIGVILEIAFLPLIHGAFLSSIVFSVFNFFILKIRIGHEQKALTSYCLGKIK